jgi:hypothetical protein
MQFLRLNNVFLPLQSVAFKSEGDGEMQVFKICTADLQIDLGTIPIAPGKIHFSKHPEDSCRARA